MSARRRESPIEGPNVSFEKRGLCGATTFSCHRPTKFSPLGVDVAFFKPDTGRRAHSLQKLGWKSNGPPVIGISGRPVAAKGLSLLMQALDACTEPWRALFLGAGQMERALRKWAARYGDNVRLLRVPHDAVPSYVNAMDMLCAPSQTTPAWREQFERMLVEAFACGIPVIGSNSGEIAAVLGNAGVIVDEGDVAGWTQGIGDLLSSPRKRRELGATGLDSARSRYAWPRIAGESPSFFEGL